MRYEKMILQNDAIYNLQLLYVTLAELAAKVVIAIKRKKT